MEKGDILKRVDELLSFPTGAISHDEMPHATISLLTLVYGERSPQLAAYIKKIDKIRSDTHGVGNPNLIARSARGARSSLKREIESGLIGSLRQQVTGEVLTALVQLSRTVITERSDKGKNVAAVLAAAAFGIPENTVKGHSTSVMVDSKLGFPNRVCGMLALLDVCVRLLQPLRTRARVFRSPKRKARD